MSNEAELHLNEERANALREAAFLLKSVTSGAASALAHDRNINLTSARGHLIVAEAQIEVIWSLISRAR